MTLNSLLAHWKADPKIGPNLIKWHTIPGQKSHLLPFPESVHPSLRKALENRGIQSLYTHQYGSWKAIDQGKNVIVVTGTASGKTLCYNLPVLNVLLNKYEATAIYLFPTKALSQDQFSVLNILLSEIEDSSELLSPHSNEVHPIKFAIYDGDTSINFRSSIRSKARLILTNPDMLHTGIFLITRAGHNSSKAYGS